MTEEELIIIVNKQKNGKGAGIDETLDKKTKR